MFLVAVGFWNFLGAGVFGFLINLPVVSYYEIGTQLTANHGHAAMMGVYGMLAVSLLVFCLRYYLRAEDWSDRMISFSFWTLNLGLAWMVFANLFPIGVLQLADVVTNGYWHARSLEFFEAHTYIEWLRLPGDAAVIAGTLPLVYLTAKSVFRMKPPRSAQELATGAPREAPVFTEVTAN
jgi:nitric oxide reductase subunit B